MRLFVGTLALALTLAACAGGRPSVAPDAASGAPTAQLQVAGYTGPIEPIATPVPLAYGPARFGSTVTIGVEGGRGATTRSNSLAAHLSGSLALDGDAVRAQLVTERIDVDGSSAAGDQPLLIQQLSMDRQGRLIEIASRWPAHTEPSQPLPERYKALEDRWRDRLPVFASAAAGPGAVVYDDTGLLAPLRQMLQNRAFELKPTKPLRAVAVGMTSCGPRRCLIARHEGEADLVAQRGTLHVTTSGYVQIDIVTGLIVNELATVTLDGPSGASRLVMTMRTETERL